MFNLSALIPMIKGKKAKDPIRNNSSKLPSLPAPKRLIPIRKPWNKKTESYPEESWGSLSTRIGYSGTTKPKQMKSNPREDELRY